MSERLGYVAESCTQGLSLTAAAALHGVLRRQLTSWVRLADEDVEPFAGWLRAICQRDAKARLEYFDHLRRVADVDVGAGRDFRRARGEPSPLERELLLLRKSATARQARLDARKLQRELQAVDPDGRQ